MTRRRLLKAGFAASVGAPALVGLYTWRVEPHWLEIVRRDLPIARLPPGLTGRTLAQLSDLHIGPSVDDAYVEDTLERVAAFGPDIVALTGDLVTYHGPEQLDQARRVLRLLPRGRFATVAILGNHDYGRGWSRLEVAASIESLLSDSGATVLRNAVTNAGGLEIAGIDDLWGPRFDAKKALGALSSAGASLVLCHNPDAADLPVWGGYRGWILAGHTHGGQCKPPFLPPPLLPVRNKRYTSGAFDLADGRRMYISRGVGHLLRVRFNVRPEVTIFRLVPGQDPTAIPV